MADEIFTGMSISDVLVHGKCNISQLPTVWEGVFIQVLTLNSSTLIHDAISRTLRIIAH